jgi:hypothetical protein
MRTIRQRLEALERGLNTVPLILTMPDGRIVTMAADDRKESK